MQVLYFICAVVGGTAIGWQFFLSLLGGWGDEDGSGYDADAGGDLTDVHDELASNAGTVGDHAGGGALHHGQHSGAEASGSWFLGMLTVRTVTAAVAFFGFAGMAASTAQMSQLSTFALAGLSGFGALYGVAWLMNSLNRLRAEGTVRIQHAVGQPATVYLTIPAQLSGAGKIQINLQNRTVECEAVTPGAELPTGVMVIVTQVLGPNRVEVAAQVSQATVAV